MRRRLTDGTGRWFETSTASYWEESTKWNGSNRISCATGSQWDHERLYQTAGGRWVLHHWSQWQGRMDRWEEITPADAARWLSINDHDADETDAAVEKAYAALEIR